MAGETDVKRDARAGRTHASDPQRTQFTPTQDLYDPLQDPLQDPLAGSGETSPDHGPGGPQIRSRKMEPGDESRAPAEHLEKDDRVLRYRWDQRGQKWLVTKYDPKKTRFDPNGRPLVGPTVQFQGQEMRLDDAIGTLDGWTGALHGSVKRLEDTPLGTSIMLSKSECVPVYEQLIATQVALVQARAGLKSGQDADAKAALQRAVSAYNLAAIKLNSARRRIVNNVELTVGLLEAVKAAGEVAEIVLVVTGAGAAGKAVGSALKAKPNWVVKAAQLGTAATVKTGYAAADQVRDHLVFKPDEPLDWGKVARDAAVNFLMNLISDSISMGLDDYLVQVAKVEVTAAKAFVNELVGNLTATTMQTVAALMIEAAGKSGQKSTPRQLAARTVQERQSEIEKILVDALGGVSKDVLASVGAAIGEDQIKTFVAKGLIPKVARKLATGG